MDPRFLRTFVTVARLGSFSAAARELGYTQSGGLPAHRACWRPTSARRC